MRLEFLMDKLVAAPFRLLFLTGRDCAGAPFGSGVCVVWSWVPWLRIAGPHLDCCCRSPVFLRAFSGTSFVNISLAVKWSCGTPSKPKNDGLSGCIDRKECSGPCIGRIGALARLSDS
jgi:hypothetical protein